MDSQHSITESILEHAADKSILETIEAFVRFRPGFHGDTGMRDFLYHRLMESLPGDGTYDRGDGHGTLLVQAEWYTRLKYQKNGATPSLGRFDLGIPRPDELDLPRPSPFAAFECGRNKKAADLVQDIDADGDHETIEPADITKLAREIMHMDLQNGYALEFYDDDARQAEDLIRRLRARLGGGKFNRLHVAVLVCIGERTPGLTLLPAAWDERIQAQFRADLERIKGLVCVRGAAGSPKSQGVSAGRKNRVSSAEFLASCSAEARALIEAIERRFGNKVKLLFGGNSMTVNARPSGRLFRIGKTMNSIQQLEPAIGRKLSELLGRSAEPNCEIDDSAGFRDAVLDAVASALNLPQNR